MACHVWKNLVDCCKLVGCEKQLVCVEIGVSALGGCLIRVGCGCMRCFIGWVVSRHWSGMVGGY